MWTPGPWDEGNVKEVARVLAPRTGSAGTVVHIVGPREPISLMRALSDTVHSAFHLQQAQTFSLICANRLLSPPAAAQAIMRSQVPFTFRASWHLPGGFSKEHAGKRDSRSEEELSKDQDRTPPSQTKKPPTPARLTSRTNDASFPPRPSDDRRDEQM